MSTKKPKVAKPHKGKLWWMLEVQRTDGSWLATGRTLLRVNAPKGKHLEWDGRGRKVRWVVSPVQSELADHDDVRFPFVSRPAATVSP